MNIPLDEVVFFDAITSNPNTGAAADADSTPTFAVYEESTDTDIGVGGNMTKRTSLTGNYRGSFTASAANGFELGKWYSVIVSATVSSVAGKVVAKNFRLVAAETVAGYPQGDVARLLGTALTETSAGYLAAGFKKQYDVATPVFTSASVNQTGDGYAMGGRTWYVDDDTDGTGDTGSREAPFDTYEAAEAAATAGDTIAILGTYSSQIIVTKSGLTITSAGGTVSYAGDGVLAGPGSSDAAIWVQAGVNRVTIRDLKITGSNSVDGVAITLGSRGTYSLSYGNKIINCDCVGRFDTIQLQSQANFLVENCDFRSVTSAYDGGNITGGSVAPCYGRFIGCLFLCDGSSVASSMETDDGNRALYLVGDNFLTFDSCWFVATRAITKDYDLAAIGIARDNSGTFDGRGNYCFNNCDFIVKETGGGNGRVYGIGADTWTDGRLPFSCSINGGRIITATAGTTPDSGPWDIDASSGSLIDVKGPIATSRAKMKEADGTGANIIWDSGVISDAAASAASADGKLPIQIKKNTAFPGFKFKLEKSNGDPATGKTVTAQRLIDAGSFANCTNSVSEKSGGWYSIDLSAADLNGDCIALKFTASGAKQRDMLIVTQA